MGFFDGPLGPLQLYKSSKLTIALTTLSSCIFATTTGYDTALINGINIIPSYTETLKLTTVTKSLNAAASFLGWAIVSTFMGPVVDRVGRRTGVLISVFLKLIGVTLMTAAQNVEMFVIGRMVLGAGSGTSSIAASTDGDRTDPVALEQFQEIVNTLEAERRAGKKLTYKEVLRTPNSRRRLMLVVSVAVLAMSSGNNIVSYYLGDMLKHAGITNTHTQLEINIILNAWALTVACVGTVLMNVAGRKMMCLVSVGGMTLFLFLVGAFTKLYGGGGNISGVYGTVATIFLFQGSYSIGITPLTILYPPEVLNFSIRSNGMAAWTFSITCGGLFSVFVWPIALEHIGWRTYMINAAWNVVQFIFVAIFWVETKGLTLEQIDAKFEELNQSGNLDVEESNNGKEMLEGVEMTDKEDDAPASTKLESVAPVKEL
ncbi:putative hexose transporter protein [Phaeoacremonium minimum UCRPA7]|uniref:Putative hexose transporter protein n=1 Tax=Phaeoacremonium minimum (strain UCR-PA7) TaxID=1286976 RepID=R8BAZ1_PHAM7|nr:putative hexose transporter protein [Phaeoacremonium minimum UCRPA7]EON96459.1 putative hexose transporter protein [Phaeoacremonium minimum UCRPA7]